MAPPAPPPNVEEVSHFHAPVPASLSQAPLGDLLARLERGMATRRAPTALPAPAAPVMTPSPPPVQAAPVERPQTPAWVAPLPPQPAPVSVPTPEPRPVAAQPVAPVFVPPTAPIYEPPIVGGPMPIASTPIAPTPLRIDMGQPAPAPRQANVLDGDAMLDEPLHMALEKLRELVRKHG